MAEGRPSCAGTWPDTPSLDATHLHSQQSVGTPAPRQAQHRSEGLLSFVLEYLDEDVGRTSYRNMETFVRVGDSTRSHPPTSDDSRASQHRWAA